ncbi:MAG: hypothetical protein QOE27_2817 [Solirubrobacteraceae bacterium]|jgi:hypothetical protein|nr:hypothetical protein [Solirubrobacteraceae bacterium]MEA2355540.1 hypothetical protein [Solirubrobacteraceae bacterium]
MPRIIVEALPADAAQPVMTMAERVLPSDLESEHFAHQLIERLGWALADAKAVEVGPASPRPAT